MEEGEPYEEEEASLHEADASLTDIQAAPEGHEMAPDDEAISTGISASTPRVEPARTIESQKATGLRDSEGPSSLVGILPTATGLCRAVDEESHSSKADAAISSSSVHGEQIKSFNGNAALSRSRDDATNWTKGSPSSSSSAIHLAKAGNRIAIAGVVVGALIGVVQLVSTSPLELSVHSEPIAPEPTAPEPTAPEPVATKHRPSVAHAEHWTLGNVIPLPLRMPRDAKITSSTGAELSGLDWLDSETLVIVPQRPWDVCDPPCLLTLSRSEIYAAIGCGKAVQSDGHPSFSERQLIPGVITLTSPGGFESARLAFREAENIPSVPGEFEGFEGFEAVAVVDNQLYLTIEASRRCAPDSDSACRKEIVSYVVRATLNQEKSEAVVNFQDYATLPAPTSIHDMGDEAIVATQTGLLVLHEVNLPVIDELTASKPMGRLVDPHNLSAPPKPITIDPFAFRLTDATQVNANGEMWVLNYLWNGESHKSLLPKEQEVWDAVSMCSGDYGRRPLPVWLPPGQEQRTITRGDWSLEQLTKVVYQEGKVTCLGQRILLEAYVQGGRNWEGLAQLDDVGWILAADAHTNVGFAFTPARPISSDEFGDAQSCGAGS